MGVPLATTTVTVTRSTANVQGAENTDTDEPLDPYDPVQDQPGYPDALTTTVASDVNAVVTTPSASVNLTGGQRDVYGSTLTCDPIPDLQPDDMVADAITGLNWRVLWVTQVDALGLNFTKAGLRLVTGASA